MSFTAIVAHSEAELLSGLPDRAVGWHTRDDSIQWADGDEDLWGELAALAVGPSDLLVVGFETDPERARVEVDELLRLAREGVDRVGLDG